MDRADVDRVLADPVAQQLIVAPIPARLAYTARDGTPRVIPIGYTWTGTAFVAGTTPNSAKVAALRANPAVALTVDTDTYPPHVLLVRGTAALESVDGVPQEYLDASRRFVPAAQWETWQAGVRGLYVRMVLLTITPHWAKVLDFETRLPTAVEELARGKG
jgi:Pyridoxamine 5'-phosphate oxidase